MKALVLILGLVFSLLLTAGLSLSVYANPGNTEVENLGLDAPPSNNINFGITEPDGIKSLTSGNTLLFDDACPNSGLNVVGLDKDIGLPKQLTIVDCEDDMDTTIWQLTVEDAVCIGGSCLPPELPPVGGELLPIDSTALILAGAQTNAVWLMSALAVIGSVAFGALYITSKKN